MTIVTFRITWTNARRTATLRFRIFMMSLIETSNLDFGKLLDTLKWEVDARKRVSLDDLNAFFPAHTGDVYGSCKRLS